MEYRTPRPLLVENASIWRRSDFLPQTGATVGSEKADSRCRSAGKKRTCANYSEKSAILAR